MNRKIVLLAVLVLIICFLAGCSKVEFAFSGLDIEHDTTEYSEYYEGSGSINTKSNGSYYVLVGYEKDGGDSSKTGERLVIVSKGEGKLYTNDSSYGIDEGEEFEVPQYTFESLGYIKFDTFKKGDFKIQDFKIDEITNEYLKIYSGSGTLVTKREGIYSVLIYYERVGGEAGDAYEDGYFICNVINGKGDIKTFDSFGVGLGFDYFNYDFKVIGSIEYASSTEGNFEVSDFDIKQVPGDHWIDYAGEGSIKTEMKGNYLLLVEFDKSGGDESGRLRRKLIYGCCKSQ